ncbi:type II secretion system secretin GspD [soil metagenome]
MAAGGWKQLGELTALAGRSLATSIVYGGLLVAGGCAGSPTLETDPLDNLDLSPKGSTRGPASSGNAGGWANKPRYEIYAGDKPVAQTGEGTQAEGSGVNLAGDGYDMNFENASVSEVARIILGNVLKKSYFVDPRVEGSITMSAGRPMTENELLKSLEVALQMNGAVLMAGDGQYQILPSSAGEGSPGAVDVGRSGADIPPGFGVSVLPLRHAKAQTVMELLDGFIARSGSIRATAQGNLLLLHGSAPERQSLSDIALTFDIDVARDQAVGIATLTNTAPAEIIPKLTSIYTQPDAGGLVRFIPLERLNAILIVAPEKQDVRGAVTWISRLDRDSPDSTSYYVYAVQNGKARDLAQILTATFGSDDKQTSSDDQQVAPGEQTAQIGDSNGEPPAEDAQSGASQGKGDQLTQFSATDQPSKLADLSGVTSLKTGTIRITASATNNTLVIRAPPRDYRKILAVLREIDRPSLQVLINATIAEVALNDNLRYGVQAYLGTTKLGLFGNNPVLNRTFPGLNLLLGNVKDPHLVLDALSRVTKVRIVSSPSVVVLDNQSATIKVGDQVPITTQQVQSTTTADAPIINSIEYRDSGVILRVTPRVNASGLVTMEISQELSAVAGGTATLTPTITQRAITSTISVYSRQTVVLGGLISGQDSRDRDSVPIVNQIPLIGDLIGTTEKKRQRNELVVFITPQVIRDSVDASEVAEELRRKLQMIK